LKDHRINIGHWDVNYLVASKDAPPDLGARWHAAMQSEIARACAEHLGSMTADSDRSVWLIRTLKLDFQTMGDLSSTNQAAKSWGGQLARTIQATILAGDDEGLVLHFETRSAYLAQLLRDLAAGVAASKWYYQEFAPLFPLSVSRAISEALTAEPEEIGPALVQLLSLGALTQVLLKLTDSEAEILFESWRASSPAQPDSDWAGRLLEVWSKTPFREPSIGAKTNLHRDALWWSAIALSAYPASGSHAVLVETVQKLLGVREALSRLSLQAREEVVELLARGDFSSAARIAPDSLEALEFFGRCMGSDPEWARQAQGVLLGEHEYVRTSAKIISRGPAIPSLNGGLFRLGPSLIECGASSLSPVMRYVIALKCLGRDRIESSIGDGVVRLFAGWEGEGFEEASRRESHIPAPETNRPSSPYWLMEEVDLPHSRILLLRDILEDEWVWAALAEESALQRARDFAAGRGAEILRAGNSVEDMAAELNIPAKRILRGARPAGPDLMYFALAGATPGIGADLDLAGSLFARATLKHFARRLIGFEASSPEHLYQNFLAGIAFVRDTAEQIEVELAPPPLSIVLSMSGILEETYSLPWIEGRTVCLRRPAQ
jgi:hypothetical protein